MPLSCIFVTSKSPNDTFKSCETTMPNRNSGSEVIKLFSNTWSMSSTVHDSKNRGYKSSRVRFLLNTIWSQLYKPVEEILTSWSTIEHGNSCKQFLQPVHVKINYLTTKYKTLFTCACVLFICNHRYVSASIILDF